MWDDIETRFDNYSEILQALEWISLFFVVLMVFETVWDYITKVRPNLRESFANTLIAVGNSALEFVGVGLLFILGVFFVEYFIPYQLPITWWSWVLAIVFADLTYYWMHRIEHEIRFFWTYHSVHHSSTEYNLTTSLRLAWVEVLIEWLFLIPMLLLGFSAPQIIIALYIVVVYQTWIHTEKIGKLGWVDRVFNTPSVHRVHHGSNKYCLDKNYGGIFIVWDRIFGTYQAEDEKVIYGITKPVNSSNPIKINVHETLLMIGDMKRANSLSASLKYLIKRPGWLSKGHQCSSKLSSKDVTRHLD